MLNGLRFSPVSLLRGLPTALLVVWVGVFTIAAFSSDAERKETNQQFNGEPLTWKDINPLK